MDQELPTHPGAGSVTGEYLVSEDGSIKVPAIVLDPRMYSEVKSQLDSYKWKDEDFLLATYPKNGTHFMWEVMTMLLHGSADYITDPKEVLMIDVFPVGHSEGVIPPPRVLNTHYRTDVLSSEFRKAKTVIVMRNPKDTCVSYYHHEVKIQSKMAPNFAPLADLKFSQYVKLFLQGEDQPYGGYFDYTEYMWTLKNDPNTLLVFFEDLKEEPLATIHKVNEFMGTGRSAELVQKIADATVFHKMKKAKATCPTSEKLLAMMKAKGMGEGDEKLKESTKQMYRKGGIGDWKNHFTVAENELFDSFLESWEGGKDIPFKY